MQLALLLLAGLVLALAGCGSSGKGTTDAHPGLDDAGESSCYLFFKWTEDATILNGDEMHKRVKKIWDAAQDSSNTVIRSGVRDMLEAEVHGDYDSLAVAGSKVGDECERQ